jgi:DNA-binding IclR family transcriptional regulator
MKKSKGMSGEDARGSGARTILVLRCIAEGEPEFTLSAISQKLKLSPSTVHRLLRALTEAGLVERTPSQSYRIGAEFFRLAALVAGKFEMGRRARPYLHDLWKLSQETCAFGLYRQATQSVMIAEVIHTTFPLRYVIEKLTTLSLTWGSLGRAILAHLPESEFQGAYAAASTGPLSGRPPPSRQELRAALSEIRKRGYAVYEDRAHLDVAGVAAPVFNAAGEVIGAMGVMMPLSRFDKYPLAKLSAPVMAHARMMSESLGFAG